MARDEVLSRRLLFILAISLISIVVASSIVAYELSLKSQNISLGASPKVLWQRPIANFASSLAVDDGKVFTTDNLGNVSCFDSQNGESIWNSSAREGFLSSGIAISGGKVYVGFEERGVGCLDENTGQLLWTFQNDQAPEGTSEGFFDWPAEIIINGDRLFAITDTISAHNLTTGALLWKATYGELGKIWEPGNHTSVWQVSGYPLDGNTFDGNYVYATVESKYYNSSSLYFFKLDTDNVTVLWRSSVTWNNFIPEVKIFPIVLATTQGQVIIEVLKNNGALSPLIISLDSNTGEELWSTNIGVTIYNPVVYNNLLLFGAADGNFYALHLTDGTIAWKTNVDPENLFASVLNYTGNRSYAQTSPTQIDSQNQRLFWSYHIYQIGDSGNYTATLCSLDLANGNLMWTKQIDQRAVGTDTDSLTFNNGKIFFTGNAALWIFDALSGNLFQSRQFDHSVSRPIVLDNKTLVAADVWLFAYG